MQKANPIRKRARPDWVLLGPGRTRMVRDWYAVCPECGKPASWSDRGLRRATRKNTKDALYRHIQEHHGPGSVGRV